MVIPVHIEAYTGINLRVVLYLTLTQLKSSFHPEKRAEKRRLLKNKEKCKNNMKNKSDSTITNSSTDCCGWSTIGVIERLGERCYTENYYGARNTGIDDCSAR